MFKERRKGISRTVVGRQSETRETVRECRERNRKRVKMETEAGRTREQVKES